MKIHCNEFLARSLVSCNVLKSKLLYSFQLIFACSFALFRSQLSEKDARGAPVSLFKKQNKTVFLYTRIR